MSHHHHHHHDVDAAQAGQVLIVGIVLNILYVVIETGMGLYYHSLGLLSDAGHNLGDVFSLILALLAYRLAALQPTKQYTDGYRKSTILVSLLNAIILLVAVGAIIVESVRKLQMPAEVNGEAVSWTAALGIVVNGITAYMLVKARKDDLNMRGAFLHMAADTLVSIGVLLSGIAIMLWNITIVDPIISMIIAVVILVSTWRLLTDSLRLSLDGVPDSIDVDAVKQAICDIDGVVGVHHIHVWAMSTTQNAITAHLVINNADDMSVVKRSVKSRLSELSITHATLEIEVGEACADCECC